MFINDLFNDKNKTLNEVSNELLGRYKKAAGADASAADKRGDVEQGNKRFKGIVKATIKQGDNDAKKHKAQGVAEGKEDKIKQLRQDHATAVHWSKNDTNPHKREAARQKAEKIKHHLETQYKQGVAEGLPQTLRKVVPGYARREIDKKMDAEKFGRTDVDRDANYYRYKKIQDKIKNKGVVEGSMIDDLLDAPGKVIRKAQDAARGMPPGTVPDSQDDLVNTATKIGKQVIDTATDAARGIPTGTVPKPQKDKDVKEQIGDVPKGWEAKTQPDGSTRISKIGSMSSADYKQNMADYKAKNWTPEKIAKYGSGQGYTDAERSANYQQQQKSFGQYADKPLDEQGVAEAGPFSYGKPPRKGSVADLAAKKRKEQEKGTQPVEPKDQMVGVAKVTKGVAEGKKPDNYHIVNKDGKPASLASYADRASAEKDRDAKHPGAQVRQVGPRGKVKGVSESGLNRPSDHRKLGQELAHETNNIEISINGRVWKIFAGKGPDSSKEFFQQKQAVDSMCKRKTAETGKKWSWGVTGAAATNEGTKCNMTEQGRACPEHDIMECPGYSRLMGEAFKMPPESIQDKLHKRHQELRKKSGLPDPEHYLKLKKQKEQELVALRAEIAADKEKGLTEERYLEELQRAGYDVITEKKIRQRLDPSCWKGYKKQGTKIKGGVRVNNCVPKE